MDFQILLSLQAMLFLLIAIGFVTGKIKIMQSEGRKCLTDLLIYVIMPCNIFTSFQSGDVREIMGECLIVGVISLWVQILSTVLSRVLYTWTPERKRSVMQYGTICSNAGFIGMAAARYLFGSEGLLYTSIFLIPFRIFMWSAGLSVYAKPKGKEVVTKVLLHPCIIAVFLGLAVALTRFGLPYFLTETLDTVGGCTTAVSMIMIGNILSEVDIKKLLDKYVVFYTFVRLLLIPGITYLALRFLVAVPPMVFRISVMLAGMPAASTTAILAAKYQADAEFAARCVFVTTLGFLVTIPIFLMV